MRLALSAVSVVWAQRTRLYGHDLPQAAATEGLLRLPAVVAAGQCTATVETVVVAVVAVVAVLVGMAETETEEAVALASEITERVSAVAVAVAQHLPQKG